jgi:hypothetical protein
VIVTSALSFDILAFLITFALFICVAYRKHRTAFQEYCCDFSLQSLGTFVSLAINAYQDFNGLYLYISNRQSYDIPFRTVGYLHTQTV